MFVVTVTIRVRPEDWEEFLPLMHENARLSVQKEPACVQFDVCRSHEKEKDHSVFLYEVYLDKAAFQSHLQTSHFKSFDAAVAQMTVSKEVQTFDHVDQG